MTNLLIIKVAITMGAVIGLSLLAERVSARLAGLLAGYPLGIAIVLGFIGLEQGVVFASEAAVYAIVGLSANVLLALVYWRLAGPAKRLVNVLWAGMVAIVAFLSLAALLQPLAGHIGLAIPITLLSIGLAIHKVKTLPITSVRGRSKIGFADMLVRAAIATVTVLLITGLAALIGPAWAGLLAGFPVVAFPLFLILHYHYGPELLTLSIKAYPMGLLSLLIYTTSVALSYPLWGLLWGTLLGFVCATLYLLLLQVVKYKR
ncbi:MAG: hypothetical protein QGI54_11230 [Gammaproteobacteria bacterium]|jgi:hypothetical protein|nr:hypothetical protein [Gammaproteobacteria bacterium]